MCDKIEWAIEQASDSEEERVDDASGTRQNIATATINYYL
jgi:hypothetical protein